MVHFLTLKQKIWLAFVGVLLFLNFLAWQYVFALNGPRHLKVDVLNVGQGDSIFIETPSMRQMLIDGGPDATVISRLYALLPVWQKSLDVVILTHPDADHLNGLLYVLQKYKVDYVVWTGIVRGGEQYQKWLLLLAEAKQRGTHIIIAKSGDQIKTGGVAMDILHPFTNLTGQDFRPTNDDNDTGIVSRLIYGNNSFLFAADISSAVEDELINNKTNLASDILKIPHHGSKYSSSPEFLQAVHPNFAVISVGAHNTYGHPRPEVLQRLQKFGITTLRTDQVGNVKMLSDGNNIKINKN